VLRSGLLLLFLAVSLVEILNVIDAYGGFITYGMSPGADEYFSVLRYVEPWEIISAWIQAFSSIITEAIFVWRLYVLWNKRYLVIVPPVFLFFGSFVSSLVALAQITANYVNKRLVYSVDSLLVASRTTYFTDTAAILYVTSMICWKLWTFRKDVGAHLGAHRGRFYSRLIITFMESGALYCVVILASGICNVTNGPAANAIDYIDLCIVGLAPTLLAIRLQFAADDGATRAGLSRLTRTHIKFAAPGTALSVADNSTTMDSCQGASVPDTDLKQNLSALGSEKPDDLAPVTSSV